MSVSQLCEMGYNCLFMDKGVEVYRREDSSIAFMGHLKGKLYLVDFTSNRVNPKTCLMEKSSKGWFSHRRLAQVRIRKMMMTTMMMMMMVVVTKCFYGRTAQNSPFTEALVFHQTLSTPKASYIGRIP